MKLAPRPQTEIDPIVNRRLFHVGQQIGEQGRAAERRGGGELGLVQARRKCATCGVVAMGGDAELAEVRCTLRLPRRLACRLTQASDF